jgi:anaerobic C4-dicarboxylate transporter
MDLASTAKGSAVVFVVLYVIGIFISMLSSYLQCSKTDISESAKEGAVWAFFPTLVYSVSSSFEFIRSPFSSTFVNEFGILNPAMPVGYLVMISTWITTIMVIHSSQTNVCQPSVAEMAEFKKKLLIELQQKQEAEEKNKESKK